MSKVDLEGLTIKEEPMYQEIEKTPEVLEGVENSVYTNIVKQKIETLIVKNDHVEESKIKVENVLHPVVRFERNFQLEQALKGGIKSEPQVSANDNLEGAFKEEAFPSAGGSKEEPRDQQVSPTSGASNATGQRSNEDIIATFWRLMDESRLRSNRSPYHWKQKLKSLQAEQKEIALKLINDVIYQAWNSNLGIHSRIANDSPGPLHCQDKQDCHCMGPLAQNQNVDGLEDENMKKFGGLCDEFNNVSEHNGFQNQMQTMSLISGLSMVVCVSCNQCFREKNCLKDHICVGVLNKCYSGIKQALKMDESAYNNDSKTSKHVGRICSISNECKLSKHKNTVQNRTHVCEICGSKFKKKMLFSRHCKNHLLTCSKPIACLQCGKSFKTKVQLNIHLITHSEKKQFSCGHCDKLFKRKNGLQMHIRRFHSGEQKKYECGECSKSFCHIQTVKSHKLRAHSESRPLSCDECGDTFKDRKCLEIHIRTHTGLKPYSCSFCDKKFTQHPHLKTHERLHTGVKPYLCKICGKSFRDSSNFKVHQIFHSGLRPFKCDKCGKGFTQRSHLNTHKKTHSEGRPYVCDICGKSFKIRNTLASHVLLHSDVKPFNCENCGKSFAQMTAFKRHKCY